MTEPTTPETTVPPVETPDVPTPTPDTPAPTGSLDGAVLDAKQTEIRGVLESLATHIGDTATKEDWSDADVKDIMDMLVAVKTKEMELKALKASATPEQATVIEEMMAEINAATESGTKHLAEVQEKMEAAAVKKAEEDLDKDADPTGKPTGTPATPAGAPAGPTPSRMDRLTDALGKGFEKMMEFFAKMGEMFGQALDKMGMNAKGVLKFAEAVGFTWLAEAVRPKVEVNDTHAVMEKVFGKGNIVMNKEEDHAAVRTLKEQYESLLESEKGKTDGKTSSSYSFETFLKEKAESVKAGGKTQCSIEDLAGGKTAVDAQREKEAEKKRLEEEEKRKADQKKAEEERAAETAKQEKEAAEKKAKQDKIDLGERMKTNGDVRNAVYLASFAEALNGMGANIKIDAAEMKKDMDGKRTDAYQYKTLAKAINSWLQSGDAHTVLGIELGSGNTLEEHNGSNYVYDSNLMINFDLENNPYATINRLLNELKLGGTNELADGTNINNTAYGQISVLQNAIKAKIGEYTGAELPAPATK